MFGKTALLCSHVVSRNSISFHHYSNGPSKRLFEILANMPKPNSARIAEAQKQRQQIATKAKKYSSSTVYLQVLGSGANGAPNTLYLFSDQKRYLFNCGECTQRLAHEHKVRLTKLDHIFITGKTWQNIGGLPGLSLTLQDVGVPNITLHGPEGLDELYYATKRFVVMKDMNVTMANCSPVQDFEDEVMNVRYVLIGPKDKINLTAPAKKQKLDNSPDKDYQEFINDNTDYYDKRKPNNKIIDANKIINARERAAIKLKQTEKDTITKKKLDSIFEASNHKDCTIAYICSLKKRLGTLDLAKCVEKGVKPGPLLGQLKNGLDVVLPDGTFVSSKDVKTPDEPGPVFIVLEVVDMSYLNEKEFEAHFDNGLNPPENIPTVIVHYTPPHVFNDDRYRLFMSRFGTNTRHLVLNSQNSCLGSEAVHRTQYRLHLLDTEIFPMLKDKSITAVWNSQPLEPKSSSPVKSKCLEDLKNKIAIAQFQNIITARCKGEQLPLDEKETPRYGNLDIVGGKTLMIQHLRPNKALDRSAEPKLHIQDYLQEAMDISGFSESLEAFRNIVEEMRYSTTLTQEDYPKVVFMGTGSCIPSKTRNTSAIVIQINENHSMLLDCGEGTFGQLVRFYGPKRVNAFLRTLKAVYVSHLHADHHIGLIGVLQARRRAFEELNSEEPIEPLYLLAPGQIYTWLSTYDQHFEKIRPSFVLVPNQHLMFNSPNKNTELTPAMMAAIGIENIVTCHVCHCPNAFGVAVQVDAANKITYSGDTIPCDDLVTIGENSTLLIHEATMEDELAEEARIKMHSTTSQAIEIGRKMNAKFTVLTHFSQRYARLPRLNSQILNDNTTVGIAFDNMQITMNDLKLLPFMYAPLQMLFSEHCVEMEMRAAHRSQKKSKLVVAAMNNLPNAQRAYSTDSSGSISPSDAKNRVGLKYPTEIKASIKKPIPLRAHYVETYSSCLRRINASNRSISGSKPPSQIKSSFNKARFQLYVETHSSRLRQEKKGMQVFGIKRKEIKSGPPPAKQASDASDKQVIQTNVPIESVTTEENISPCSKTPEPEIEAELEDVDLAPSATMEEDILRKRNPAYGTAKWNSNINSSPIKLQHTTASRQKSFQPELEDINSSYMLILNSATHPRNRNRKHRIGNGSIGDRKGLHRPKPLDEDKRRKLLCESKKKFASRTFKNEIKFERIEGLNWISWK